MESRIYSVLFQFSQGIEPAQAGLDTLEKMDLEPPGYVQQIRVRFQEVAASANSHFDDRVSKQEIRKQLGCEWERRQEGKECESRPHLLARGNGGRRSPAAEFALSRGNTALARIKALASSQQSAQPTPDDSSQSPPSGEGSAQA